MMVVMVAGRLGLRRLARRRRLQRLLLLLLLLLLKILQIGCRIRRTDTADAHASSPIAEHCTEGETPRSTRRIAAKQLLCRQIA